MTPDAGFAAGGRLQIYPSGLAGYDEIFPRDAVSDVTVDQQGRIVVVGTAEGSLPIDHSDALVARFNLDGSLDTSFSGDGILHFEWEPENSYATSVALDHQGRIVVAGGTWGSGSFESPAVARFLPDGTPDPTFGEGGLRTVAIEGSAAGVAVDAQNRVLISTDALSRYFAALRFTEDGELDESFGGDGIVLTDFPGAEYSISRAIAVDSSGRVVVVGGLTFPTGTSFGVVRYTESGSLDPAFGNNGRVVLDFGALEWEHATDVVVDGEGRVLVVGDGGSDALVGRLLADGKPDPSFGGDGRVITSRPSWLSAESAAIDSAGRILVAGIIANEQIPSWSAWPYPNDSAYLLRYGADGNLEEDLGPEGFVRENFLAPRVTSASVAIDQQGRYLLAGSLVAEAYGSELGFLGLARFLVDYPAPATPQPQQSSAPPAPAPPRCHGKDATIIGTKTADVLRGTKRRDVIVGLGGDDVIRGLGGDDLVCAGGGSDLVRGGAGNDLIDGEAGKDHLFGDRGQDRLNGGAGVDRSSCGSGRDVAVVDRSDQASGCELEIRRKSRH